jgi:hypothetical protein
MNRNSPSNTEAQARYAVWERQATTISVVLLLVLGVSFYFQIPSVAFAVSNAIAGVLAFFVWRATLAHKMKLAVVLSLLAIVATLLGLVLDLSQRIEPLVVQAFGLQALALFAGILLARGRVKSI